MYLAMLDSMNRCLRRQLLESLYRLHRYIVYIERSPEGVCLIQVDCIGTCFEQISGIKHTV